MTDTDAEPPRRPLDAGTYGNVLGVTAEAVLEESRLVVHEDYWFRPDDADHLPEAIEHQHVREFDVVETGWREAVSFRGRLYEREAFLDALFDAYQEVLPHTGGQVRRDGEWLPAPPLDELLLDLDEGNAIGFPVLCESYADAVPEAIDLPEPFADYDHD